jgi:hypothetical protein
MGHTVAWWLRHCATNRKVAGSIPDGVTGFFHWHKPSGRTMALTTLSPSGVNCLKTWAPQPPGTLRACQGL